jgi:hypothetical protein
MTLVIWHALESRTPHRTHIMVRQHPGRARVRPLEALHLTVNHRAVLAHIEVGQHDVKREDLAEAVGRGVVLLPIGRDVGLGDGAGVCQRGRGCDAAS